MTASEYFVLNTTNDGDDRVLVDEVSAAGAVRRTTHTVERVYYVRTTMGAAEVRAIVAKLAAVALDAISCRAVSDPGWVEVRYVHQFRLDIGATDEWFDEVLTLSKDAAARLWLTRGIGASRWHKGGGAPLKSQRSLPFKTAIAVAVHGCSAVLTLIDIASATFEDTDHGTAADEKQCMAEVSEYLRALGAVVIISHQPAILKALAAPARLCINIYDAIKLLGIAKNIQSLYQLCRLLRETRLPTTLSSTR